MKLSVIDNGTSQLKYVTEYLSMNNNPLDIFIHLIFVHFVLAVLKYPQL